MTTKPNTTMHRAFRFYGSAALTGIALGNLLWFCSGCTTAPEGAPAAPCSCADSLTIPGVGGRDDGRAQVDTTGRCCP